MKALILLLTLVLSIGSAFAAYIDFENLSEGQVRVVGSGFTRSATGNKQVNFYVNGDYLTKITMNSNGSFSYTTKKNEVSNGDQLTVKVLQYNSSQSHFTKTNTYYFKKQTEGSVTVEALDYGQVRVVGKNFVDSKTNDDQVNIYKNGDFLNKVNLNSNGSFSYTSPKNTFTNNDKITVKVLQYYGNGDHAVFTGTYKKVVDSSYIAACYANTGTYTNEQLCLSLRVPARISYACGAYAGTYSNEATCLKAQTEPETTKACATYMGTYTNEAACLKTKNLSPSIIRDCSVYSWTYAGELACIQNAM